MAPGTQTKSLEETNNPIGGHWRFPVEGLKGAPMSHQGCAAETPYTRKTMGALEHDREKHGEEGVADVELEEKVKDLEGQNKREKKRK